MYTYHIHVHIFHVLSHIRVLIPKPYKLARQYMLGIDTLMYDSKWNNYVCTCVHCMCTYYIPPHTDQSKCMCRAESSLSLSLSLCLCVCVCVCVHVCVYVCVCVCVCVCTNSMIVPPERHVLHYQVRRQIMYYHHYY